MIQVMQMKVTDNNWNISKVEFCEEYPQLSSKLLDKTLGYLIQKENLIVFPDTLTTSEGVFEDSKVIESVNNKVKTNNIVGFIGLEDEYLTIQSRFSKEDDFFLHYMLQKVLSINVINLPVNISFEEQLYNFIIYLFPRYLKLAFKKGVYKEYERFEYNDNRVRGNVNIVRHLKHNIPFTGNIAYSTRELTAQNNVMLLIRLTIEHLKSSKIGQKVLKSDAEVAGVINEIKRLTPEYNLKQRKKIIEYNQSNPVRHAYFQDYHKLQQLCLMILNKRKHTVGNKKSKVFGILIDIAWLWEEYLNTLLKDWFIHPENRKRSHKVFMFINQKHPLYPDFIGKENNVVLDAKYKKLEESRKGINREDLYQIITYLHILKSQKAGILYPSTNDTTYEIQGVLDGFGGEIFKQSLLIPQNSRTYSQFVEQMKDSEIVFLEQLGAEVR